MRYNHLKHSERGKPCTTHLTHVYKSGSVNHCGIQSERMSWRCSVDDNEDEAEYIAGFNHLESRTLYRSVEVFAGNGHYNAHEIVDHYRERIVALWDEGTNVSAIVRALHEEGQNTTRGTVHRWIFCWSRIEDDIRKGHPSKITSKIRSIWSGGWMSMTRQLQSNCRGW